MKKMEKEESCTSEWFFFAVPCENKMLGFICRATDAAALTDISNSLFDPIKT